MNISDVMIHINETLNDDARTTLEKEIQKVEGVVSSKFNPGKEHLLMIAFDLDKTTPAVLLEKSRAAGYTTQLVGM
jgi:cell division protein FtsX